MAPKLPGPKMAKGSILFIKASRPGASPKSGMFLVFLVFFLLLFRACLFFVVVSRFV